MKAFFIRWMPYHSGTVCMARAVFNNINVLFQSVAPKRASLNCCERLRIQAADRFWRFCNAAAIFHRRACCPFQCRASRWHWIFRSANASTIRSLTGWMRLFDTRKEDCIQPRMRICPARTSAVRIPPGNGLKRCATPLYARAFGNGLHRYEKDIDHRRNVRHRRCVRPLVAAERAELFLVGRNAEKLQQTADDLTTRGAAAVHTHTLDLNQFDAHPAMLDAAFSQFGQIDIALIAHGTLPDQKACEHNVDLALQEFSNNGLSVIALLTALAPRMEAQRRGTVAVISSVAGDHGRPSNTLYGAAKAAVSAFCEGLRARLFKSGVHVLTIKPGFVATPMTQGLPLPKPLVASAEKVARVILRGIERRSNVIYAPRFWGGMMWGIKAIPNCVFKRLTL